MAHNLEVKENGKASFFTVKEKAWHGLGTVVAGALTSAEAIKEASLDFEVVKLPMLEQYPIKGEDGSLTYGTKPSDERFTTLRADNNETLGYVGKGYHILQNTNAFDFFDTIVGKGEAIYETAGVLGRGERIFITAKLPSHFVVNGKKNDAIEEYIFLTNSHDGKNAVVAAFTPIRIVCNNTLSLALKNMSNSITLRHTVNMQEKLKAADQIMGIKNQLSSELKDIFSQLAKTTATEKDYEKIIVNSLAKGNDKIIKTYYGENDSTRFNNMVKEVMDYAYSHETQLTVNTKDTYFGAYNAISGFFQNAKEWKNDDLKLNNIFDGDVALKGEIAFNLCFKAIS